MRPVLSGAGRIYFPRKIYMDETKELLVFGASNTYKITIPAEAKVTFGPFSPPTKFGGGGYSDTKAGTLRIYDRSKERMLAVFSGVTGFRDLSIKYEELTIGGAGEEIWEEEELVFSKPPFTIAPPFAPPSKPKKGKK